MTYPPDVPTPIDFHDPAQCRDWVEATVRDRPWRPRFFAAFAEALAREGPGPFDVTELGSGPGHLAAALIRGGRVGRYTAIDFAAPMHDLAREHLGAEAAGVRFLIRDFRDGGWREGLAPQDVVVSMQAAHEVRHKARLPALFASVHAALKRGGLFLLCDHYAEEGTSKVPALYLEREEQPAALEAAGFAGVETLRDEGGMTLLSGRKG